MDALESRRGVDARARWIDGATSVPTALPSKVSTDAARLTTPGLFADVVDPARIVFAKLLPVAPDPMDGRPCDYWQAYVGRALRQTPQLRRGVTTFAKRLRKSPPTSMADVYGRALASAKAELARGVAHLPAPAQQQYLTAAALLILAAHTFRNKELKSDERVIQLFPRYLRDGRLNDIGYDKACHYWSHAFVSFFLLLDAAHGVPSGKLGLAIAALEHVDQVSANVDAIEAAYHQGRGRPGALLKSAKPVTEGPTLYSEPEQFADPGERAAYAASVRGGYLYKHYRTIDAFGPYAVSDVGQAGPNDPWLHDATRLQSGLWDAGVVRDLLANDLGARAGVLLYRSNGALPPTPFEDEQVSREIDPGTVARAKAITSALNAKEVSPAAILALAIAKAPPISGQAGELGAQRGAEIRRTTAGWVITGQYATGSASLTYDPSDQRPDEAALFHLRTKPEKGPHAKVSMPSTELPTRRALKEAHAQVKKAV